MIESLVIGVFGSLIAAIVWNIVSWYMKQFRKKLDMVEEDYDISPLAVHRIKLEFNISFPLAILTAVILNAWGDSMSGFLKVFMQLLFGHALFFVWCAFYCLIEVERGLRKKNLPMQTTDDRDHIKM